MSRPKENLISKLVSPQARESALDLLMQAADWTVERLPSTKSLRSPTVGPMRLIAHRGAWRERGCKENTFSAFDRAVESGVWGLEFDVRFTKDDVPVVHHDESLLRTFGRPTKISSTTLTTLRHEASEIPTFREVIDKYGSAIHYFIEIKGSRQDLTEARLRQILDPLSAKGLQAGQQFHIMTFEIETLDALNKLFEVPKAALVSIGGWNAASTSDLTLERGFGGFTSHWINMSDALLLRHHAAHQLCGVGFVNSRASLKREWSRGVDWAFTNEAPKASEWLKEITR